MVRVSAVCWVGLGKPVGILRAPGCRRASRAATSHAVYAESVGLDYEVEVLTMKLPHSVGAST